MSSTAPGRQIEMDPSQLYREEIFTDRKLGSIRMLIPVTADGSPDASRGVLYSGQAQVMTPVGALPLNFDLDATTLAGAIAKFGEAAEVEVQQTLRELQELRREQASSLVIPDSAGPSLAGPGDLLGRGRSRR
ncbi:MAG TPA: hypothetical protein VMU86_01280 [Steroidobacteraceae bacterium]|nr:hypothetical protein [Steroidobacteraceae bacterium]